MSRTLVVAAAQLGPIARAEPRAAVVQRMLALMEAAAREHAGLVVFPELALTSFFPRWLLGDDELDGFFEREMPGAAVAPLFDAVRRLRIGVAFGYAERCDGDSGHRPETVAERPRQARHFNSALLTGADGRIIGRYRKVHLPGDREAQPGHGFQHLEKRCFDNGDLGFPAWHAFGGVLGLLICNDRRWPEAWRVLGLQGVELVLVGYNTPLHNPEAPEHDAFVREQHRLVMRAGAYQNATWAVAVAKGGVEEGQALLADTIIVAPSGEIVAASRTEGDELVLAECDLDQTRSYKSTIFDFGAHRQPQAYRRIVEQVGVLAPKRSSARPRGLGLAREKAGTRER